MTELEASVIIGLAIVYCTGMALRVSGLNDIPFDDKYYAESDSLFQVLARNPAENGFGDWIVVGDTIEKPSFPININSADSPKLEFLPGIGPKMAERILEYRKESGLFKTIEDLLSVKGIGEKTLEKLRPLITLTDQDSVRTESELPNATEDSSAVPSDSIIWPARSPNDPGTVSPPG